MIPNTQKLRDAYKKAPKAVQTFITSKELNEVFEDVRTAHKLHLDEAGALSNALNAVFLEVVSLEKFPELLKEALNGDEKKRDAVLKEINERVFVVFRKKLVEPLQEEPPQPTAPLAIAKEPPIERPVVFNKPEGALAPTATSTINKIEQAVRERVTDVEINATAMQPQKAATQEKAPGYTSADPYREPLE